MPPPSPAPSAITIPRLPCPVRPHTTGAGRNPTHPALAPPRPDLLLPPPPPPFPHAPLQDIFRKEKGRYAKFVAASLASLRYQCRVAYIPAGHQGCAQVGCARVCA